MRALLALILSLALVACAALRDDLRRTEVAFSEARYEEVEVWLAELEPSVPEMDQAMRARFYYVAGVTAARLGKKARARHYLALCREEAGSQGLGLSEAWQKNLALLLDELS